MTVGERLDVRKQPGLRDIRDRAGLVETGDSGLEFLVCRCRVGFQAVQLRIPKDLPPIAFGQVRLGARQLSTRWSRPHMPRAGSSLPAAYNPARQRSRPATRPIIATTIAMLHQLHFCHAGRIATDGGATDQRVGWIDDDLVGGANAREHLDVLSKVTTDLHAAQIHLACHAPTTPTCRPSARNNNVFDGKRQRRGEFRIEKPHLGVAAREDLTLGIVHFQFGQQRARIRRHRFARWSTTFAGNMRPGYFRNQHVRRLRRADAAGG